MGAFLTPVHYICPHTAKTATTDYRYILCGIVGDITQRHSLCATGSICYCIFFVERIQPILQVLCSDLELVT